jgi:hypothetical protein
MLDQGYDLESLVKEDNQSMMLLVQMVNYHQGIRLNTLMSVISMLRLSFIEASSRSVIVFWII